MKLKTRPRLVPNLRINVVTVTKSTPCITSWLEEEHVYLYFIPRGTYNYKHDLTLRRLMSYIYIYIWSTYS